MSLHITTKNTHQRSTNINSTTSKQNQTIAHYQTKDTLSMNKKCGKQNHAVCIVAYINNICMYYLLINSSSIKNGLKNFCYYYYTISINTSTLSLVTK